MKIPNMLEIAVAWKRAANPTEEQQLIAEQRMNICDTCEFKQFVEKRMYFKCSACGCPIQKKVYSPKERSCPKDKWPV
jgi:hypothetical protein